jgi:hypothetical protein
MPFDRLTVLSRVEGLMALSDAEGMRYLHPSTLWSRQRAKGGSPSAVSSGPNGLKAKAKKLPELFCLRLKPEKILDIQRLPIVAIYTSYVVFKRHH